MANFKIFLSLICFLAAPHAFAWGKYGHVIVCEVAYQKLTGAARTELDRLLVAHDEYASFNRACLEADRAPRTRPSEHFVNYPRDLKHVKDGSCGEAQNCVISAIASDFNILSDRSASDYDRGEAMILLGHWVGDIHQPLHVSYRDDRGGNSIKSKGGCYASNLHAVWDSCIIEKRLLPGNALVRALGWYKFARAYHAAENLSQNMDERTTRAWLDKDVFEWAGESYTIATSPVVNYCQPRNDGCWYDTQNKHLDDGEPLRTIRIKGAYFDQHAGTVELRLTMAGVRLADLLNQALDKNYTR